MKRRRWPLAPGTLPLWPIDRMRRNITTCLWASGLTVSSLYGYHAIDHVREPIWLAVIAFAPGLPAFVATVVCCDTAHGFSPEGAVIVFTMTTFILWATVIYVIRWYHGRIDTPTSVKPE